MINGGIINTAAAAPAEDCTTNNSSFPTSNLAYYKLDGDAIDSAGTNNGTSTNVTWGVGKFGPAAVFNGSSSKIVTGVNLTLQSACSLSVWVYFTGSDFFPIFGGNNTISGSTTVNRHFTAINATAVRLDYISNAGAFFRASGLSLFNSNAWNHIVITDDFNNTTQSSKLYINGTQHPDLVRILPSYGGAINTNLYIGQSRTNGNIQQYATGTLDQVRIFPTVLTQGQVTELYEDEIECCTTDEVNYPVTNTAYYKLNGNATDSTTNGYNGTWGGTAAYGAGLFDDAAVFNGSSYIATTLDFDATPTPNFTDYSISMWVYKNADTNSFFAGTMNSSAKNGIYLAWLNSSNTNSNRIRFIERDTFASASTIHSTDAYAPGQWLNVVVVRNGNTNFLYVNGTAQGSTANANINHQGWFTIGRSGDYNPNALVGSIDQVRIFPTAITAGQVAELYQEKQCGFVPSEHFNTVTYTGNNGTQSITSLDFQPDFVWIKGRNAVLSNVLHDIQTQPGLLITNAVNSLINNGSNTVTFTSNGFNLQGGGNHTSVNGLYDFVAWCWKAGGAAVAAASIAATNATRSANVDAGFSIMKFHTSASTASPPPMNYIEHGLDATPEMVIYKSTSNTGDWRVMHVDNGQKWVELNTTDASAGPFPETIWDNTSTNIGVRSNYAISRDADYIAYAFHSVDGFSKFGSYVGNGSATGPSIVTGFEPAFVMVKNTTGTGLWLMSDNKRQTAATKTTYLQAQSSAAEYSPYTWIEYLSNGFQLKNIGPSLNTNGSTYIYMAFAN